MSKNTALLIIDTQVNLYTDEALEQINILLAQARATGTPVIYVQHDGQEGHPLQVGTPGWQIHPAIAPLASETVVRKESPDSFHKTTLQQELARLGIKHLIVTGGQTEYCVDTTVRRAASLGYDVTLVADAHFTGDTDVLPASQIIALFNDTLDGFWADEHVVRVKPAAEIVFSA